MCKKGHLRTYGEQLQVISAKSETARSAICHEKYHAVKNHNSIFTAVKITCAYLVNMILKDYRRASGGQLSSVPAVRKLFNTI